MSGCRFGDRARQADKTSLRLTVFRGGVGSPTQRHVAGLHDVLASVACAASLERSPHGSHSYRVGLLRTVSAAGRQHGAGERFFRALRPGLRRECPPPAIDLRRVLRHPTPGFAAIRNTRFAALVTARSEAVTMFLCMPTPNSVRWSSTSTSTYDTAVAAAPLPVACS